MVNIYKYCKKEILIQPPGEPREQHQGDVRPKKVLATQNFIKNKMTERSDVLTRWHIFEKNAKKLKMKSQERNNVVFG